MFETAEIDHLVDKDTFDAEEPVLREALLEVQYKLRESAQCAVIILIEGVEGAGKGDTVKLLNEWMDPRLIHVSTFNAPSDEELAHPPEWRYWRQFPPKGRIGVFFGNWYSQMLQERIGGKVTEAQFDQALDVAERYEHMLCDEGVLIFKFWFHLSKTQLQTRLEALKSDPQQSWKLSPLDWYQSKTYDQFVHYGEQVVRHSNSGYAPWYVIPGSDRNYRSLMVGRIILQGLQGALSGLNKPLETAPAALLPILNNSAVLSNLDMTQCLKKKDYKEQLIQEQARLAGLMRDKRMREHSLVVVFEGNDAAGKGGAIRRITEALDPRQYHIVPIAAPTDEERVQPYLWRFWRHVPGRGRFTMFDRSWYGRVLVERVEQLCTDQDWMRAYSEINDFEGQMIHAGAIVVKFWLAIDKKTQFDRFKEREKNPVKRFKITDEDWRNREKWDQYASAVGDMVERTSSRIAPWTLVEANDKRFARVKVLRTLNDRIEAELAKTQ